MKDLCALKFFLGIEFSMGSFGILLNQRKYALELIVDSGQGGAKPASTPLDFNQRLTSHEFDIATGNDNDKLLPDSRNYQRLIGKLLYLTMTRLDITYVVKVLSQFMHKPKESHMLVALRVIRYIENAPGLGLLISSASSHSLTAYCDLDWAACPQTSKSAISRSFA